LVTTAVNLSDL